MRNDLTEIILVVDRSGSMASCRDDMEGGINEFIESQKKEPNDANLTLVQFDNHYEFVHIGTPIKNVGKYSLSPRGTTALLDAVGRAINETGDRLSKINESDRPGCVVCVIVTDGHENASTEFNKQQIRDIIAHQQEKYNWHFTFLGADEQAFDEGASMGIKKDFIAQYNASEKAKDIWRVAGAKLSCARHSNADGQFVDMDYSQDERNSML